MMELVKLELDKGTKFLIWWNYYFLVSIVTGAIIDGLVKNFIGTEIALFIGLSIGLGVIIGTHKFLKKRREKNR
jgi:hypothetical protein